MKIVIRSINGNEILTSATDPDLKTCLERVVRAGANLIGANLIGADLSGANLYRANLRGADLSDANLSRADLIGANLISADLYRANLSGANLSGANLSGANLIGANLSGANLYRANLSRADLSRADLSRAKNINPFAITPLLMLLDQPGKIHAYKLVNKRNEGVFNGGLKYRAGESIAVRNANTNPLERCAAGINVATLDWCIREWCPGYRILIVEFTAKDIAAIPVATNGKFRLHRCRVVGVKRLSSIGLKSKA